MNKFLKTFIQDCKYYDLEKKELKTILRNVNLKDKTLLDVGTGTGRLAFPLSKYSKKVIALDYDKRFKPYFKAHRKKNVQFVNKSIESYKSEENPDLILLAWPTINFKFIEPIKELMNKESKFIFITCNNNSDFETTYKKLDTGKGFEEDIKNKMLFLKILPKKFKLIKKQKIRTYYTYPNEKEAFRIIKNSTKLWFGTIFNKKTDKKLMEIVKQHKKENKVIFEEEIWFYLMEKI
jgi:SAM-dependent methyltransferase